MSVRRIAIFIFLCATISASARAQVSSHDPDALLKRALHFGDSRKQDHPIDFALGQTIRAIGTAGGNQH